MPINANDETTLLKLINHYRAHENINPDLTTQRLLHLTIVCIDHLTQPDQAPKFNQLELLIALSACAFGLQQDNELANLPLPWIQIAMLKRVILFEDLGTYRNMSHLAEETVFISKIELGPHMALINYAITDIIQTDLPDLHQAITAIQQGNPIAHLDVLAQGIQRLVEYENDEYYLAKISSSASRLMGLIQPPYNTAQLTQAANHFIVLGEAMVHLSTSARQIFAPTLRQQLVDIRLVFCHPERHNNRVVVQRFVNGKINQPELQLNKLMRTMPALFWAATRARHQYQLNYQFLPNLKARTQTEMTAVDTVWHAIKTPAAAATLVTLPAGFQPATSDFVSPLSLMRDRQARLNAQIIRLNENIDNAAPQDFALQAYDPMAELAQADTVDTQNEIDALTTELDGLQYRIQQASLHTLRDTIRQTLETIVTFSALMNLVQTHFNTGRQVNHFSLHAQMRFYQIQAGSYVRYLLIDQRFTQKAQQHHIILDEEPVNLSNALQRFSQIPRGYLAHLGKRALGQSSTTAPESAYVFFTTTQILQACLPLLDEIDTALQQDQAALTLQTLFRTPAALFNTAEDQSSDDSDTSSDTESDDDDSGLGFW